MRPLFAVMLVPLVGCSNLLGIQDPSTGSDGGSGSGHDDASIDAMVPPSGDYLTVSVPSAKLMVAQRLRFHVMLMHKDGSSQDVSASTSLHLASTAEGTAKGGAAVSGAATIESVATGTATITASYADAANATVGITVTTTACHPVINELRTGTSAGGGLDEFVEIYNPCTAMINVAGWTLSYRSKGSTSADLDGTQLVSLAGMMAPGELRVYAGSSYSGTGAAAAILPEWTSGLAVEGSIGLRSGPQNTGTLVDGFAYGGVVTGAGANPFVEGTPFVTINNDTDVARAPFDGSDLNDNSMDFKSSVSAGTPGALNIL